MASWDNGMRDGQLAVRCPVHPRRAVVFHHGKLASKCSDCAKEARRALRLINWRPL